VRESEWLDVAAWVYKHFDDVSGVAFLPHSDHIYEQAPYQDLTRDEFFALKQPVIDWSKLSDFEKTDETLGAQTLACTAGGCEL
jgi:ribonucleoside-diphosphate reductase alpha chain